MITSKFALKLITQVYLSIPNIYFPPFKLLWERASLDIYINLPSFTFGKNSVKQMFFCTSYNGRSLVATKKLPQDSNNCHV